MTYKQKHLTSSVIMVRPHDFGFNEQTGTDNEFQHRPTSDSEAKLISKNAMTEFDSMVNILDKSGLEVLVLDKPETTTYLPDAIFPNNWFSTTADGQLFLYPMKTANRQAEVQLSELTELLGANQYNIHKVNDLRNRVLASGNPLNALEGTGSLIFHHQTGTIFAALSERCDRDSLAFFGKHYNYNVFPFSSHSQNNLPIYHSNVLMSCGINFAVIAESILVDDKESSEALGRLKETVNDVITITEQQMTDSFCGNILQLNDEDQQPVILMSESAYNGFTSLQIKRLEKHGSLLICPIPTIEYTGGGSARCMVAENFIDK